MDSFTSSHMTLPTGGPGSSGALSARLTRKQRGSFAISHHLVRPCEPVPRRLPCRRAHRAGIDTDPLVRPIEDAVAELGEWARGYAIDQRMSGAKARRELLWSPAHTDPVAEIS